MKAPGIFGVFVGVMMLAQWAFFLASGPMPELQSETRRIALHLAAESITAWLRRQLVPDFRAENEMQAEAVG